MDYQTFSPHPELSSIVNCYWTLKIPKVGSHQRQRIIPDGCMEMAFILGDEIKRYTTGNDYILQPRACVIGQITEPFYIEPTGSVDTFAVRFYPYGFVNFLTIPIDSLANKETRLSTLFERDVALDLEENIIQAKNTEMRIKVIENFFLNMLEERTIIDRIVKTTIDILMETRGKVSIAKILNNDKTKRKQLERQFLKQVGMTPKKLGKIIRMQAALKMVLHQDSKNLTQIAYESEYFDQSHFIKDFIEFTGSSPKHFFNDDSLLLSSLFYKKS